jgi:hypothetical protein
LRLTAYHGDKLCLLLRNLTMGIKRVEEQCQARGKRPCSS